MIDSGDMPGRLCNALSNARQQNLKARALTRRTHDVDGSAVAADDSLNRGKPQSATGEFGGEERIEDPGLHLRRNAAARVGNLQLEIISRTEAAVVDADHSVALPMASDAFVTRFITICRICAGLP